MIPFYTCLLGIRLGDIFGNGHISNTGEGPSDPAISEHGKLHPTTLLLILRRTITFAIDYFLVWHVAPWPLSFFAERGGGPVYWRFWAMRGSGGMDTPDKKKKKKKKESFRDMEVVVRRSRGWGVDELRQSPVAAASTSKSTSKSKSTARITQKPTIQGSASPYFHTRIAPVVDRTYLRTTTGYMMMGRYWDLDFGAMSRVVRMLDGGCVDDGRVEGVEGVDGAEGEDGAEGVEGTANGSAERFSSGNANGTSNKKRHEGMTAISQAKTEARQGLKLEDCRTVVVLWDEMADRNRNVSGKRKGKGKTNGDRSGSGNENGQWLSWRVF